MKPTFLFLIVLIFTTACSDNKKVDTESQTDIDAARDFIRAALDGDFKKARLYMINDSINEERMSLVERVNLSPDEKRGLAASAINIHQVNPVNDSTTVVIYSNSFKNNKDTLRVVKAAGRWLVDFNYL